MAGASNPGIPLIMNGRSEDISWGLSLASVDVSDLYKEETDPLMTKYLMDGKWHAIKTVEH